MTQIGRYELVRKTGTYGLTTLYDAFDPLMHRKVSIRVAEEDGSLECEPARATLLRVGKNLGTLDHPNIVRVLGCEENAPVPFLVLEHFDGIPLSEALKQGGALDAERVVLLVQQAAAALDHAHGKGMIHRNITPESVLISEANEVKLTAFDIAGSMQALEDGDVTGEAGVLMQSIPYISPELLLGDTPGPGSDQFSVAVIAFRCLTGKAPFGGEAPVAHMFEIAFEAPSGLAALGQKFPAAVTTALRKALSKAPDQRYASCAEFARALESALLRKAAGATRVVSSPFEIAPSVSAGKVPDPQPPPETGSKKLLIWGAAAAAAAVLGYAALSLGSRKPAPVVAKPELNEQLRNAARSLSPPASAAPVNNAKPAAAKPKKKAAARPKQKEPEPPPIELKFAEPKVGQK